MNEPYNKRFPKMWEIIEPWLTLDDAYIIDLGAGGGDMVLSALNSGASAAWAIDKDVEMLNLIERRAKAYGVNRRIVYDSLDLNEPEKFGVVGSQWYDLGFCCSLLPYLRDYRKLLEWCQTHVEVMVIEAQYAGDGPGSDWNAHINNDGQMRMALSEFWEHVTPIGKTEIADRNKCRTIWLCRND